MALMSLRKIRREALKELMIEDVIWLWKEYKMFTIAKDGQADKFTFS